ncbi:hypothetical protein [Streptomyces mexicanus]|uniref:hypothetical protein n=1 Tax=Streptomyces mexicanus TaxID=178566 RepID=UPI00365AE7DC
MRAWLTMALARLAGRLVRPAARGSVVACEEHQRRPDPLARRPGPVPSGAPPRSLAERLAYGWWLNWIESEFAALRYFALNGTDHRTHDEQNAAIAAFVRCRNGRAEPKVRFAPESPIRQWTDYPARSA